ncbi:MAG TPA: Mth938-like domain-containing protein [Rhodanobacteraceae bacterium]|nr:Mth938-like domain-containing protein [Rhodanobacteraceae bacterium]
MELNLELPHDYLFIRRADAHRVTVVDRAFTASIIVTRDRVIEDWPPRDVAALTPEHADPILALQPDVVLLGTGAHQAFPTQAVLGAFLRRNVGVEVMDNTAAARTWDILAGEGRNVVAAFIVCDRP